MCCCCCYMCCQQQHYTARWPRYLGPESDREPLIDPHPTKVPSLDKSCSTPAVKATTLDIDARVAIRGASLRHPATIHHELWFDIASPGARRLPAIHHPG